LLALDFNEPGASRVLAAVRAGTVMSAVNWAEVLSRWADRGADPSVEARRLRSFAGDDLDIVPLDDAQAAEVARLRPLTIALGLSLGDRACLALGHLLGLPVVCADQAWTALRPDFDVEVIR
jgi:ribonuclease VapC